MTRRYHVDIAQHVADADHKWVDNLLSHFDIPGVDRERQGVARVLSARGIYHVALIRQLTRRFGVSVTQSVSLAVQLLDTDVGELSIAPGLLLRVDRGVFEQTVDAAIALAVESVTPARRGRPSKHVLQTRGAP
jgi:hypothetical protein